MSGMIDLRNKAVVVTGGTMGIGLATGIAFAKAGADVTLTYKWGSVDADDVKARFRKEDAREPQVVEADVTVDEHTTALLEGVKARGHQRIHAFVSNVSVAAVIRGLEDYEERSLYRSLAASASSTRRGRVFTVWMIFIHAADWQARRACRVANRYRAGALRPGGCP